MEPNQESTTVGQLILPNDLIMQAIHSFPVAVAIPAPVNCIFCGSLHCYHLVSHPANISIS